MKNRKTIITKSILATVMLTAMFSYATNTTNIDPKSNLKKTTLTLNHVKPGNQVAIKDLSGIILYKEEIKTTGTYSKSFDLTSLPSGSYVFELEKDFEIKLLPFSVNSNQVVFDKNNETIFHKPYVTAKDNHIYINKLSLNEEPLEIKIYYLNEYQLIFSEKIEDTKSIQKAYKMASNIKGDYKVILKSNGREYYEYLTL